MKDIFEDMDKVLVKFSDDIKEVFKNYHREEVKEEVKEEDKIKRITDDIVNDINLVIKNIDELIKQQKLKDDGFLRHCIKSIEWNRDKLKEQDNGVLGESEE